jgi:cyclophilin family peptidyl-prolyl cis-trans isomerase
MSLIRISVWIALFGLLATHPSGAQDPVTVKPADAVTPESTPESTPETEQTDEPQLRAQPTAEQQAAFDQALLLFQQTRQELATALGDQQETFLRYINKEVRTPAAKREYAEKRNRVRQLLDKAYSQALDVTDTGVLNEELVRFIVTTIQHRTKIDYYDGETFEGAAKMLDSGQNLLLLLEGGARSAVVTGDFDSAAKLLEIIVATEKISQIDPILYSNLERYRDQWEKEQEILEQEAVEDKLPRVKLETTQGDVIVELFLDQAPTAVSNFIRLVEDGFYDGLDFYQVIDHSLALTGDPSSTGSGSSGKYIVDEHQRDDARNGFRGSLAMAKLPAGETGKLIPNSASSQFAILYLPVASIADQQTVFGRVIEGMDVVSRFRRVDPSKEKKKGEVVVPADAIIEATVLRRGDTLPEPEYFVPPGSPQR